MFTAGSLAAISAGSGRDVPIPAQFVGPVRVDV